MSALTASARIGAAMALRRLLGRAGAGIAAGAVGFSALAAYAERDTSAGDAASRVLQGPTFGLAVPVAVLALVAAALARARLDTALAGPAALGAGRRACALGALGCTAAVAVAVAALAAALAALVAHGSFSAPAMLDAAACAKIGALSGLAYAGLFGAASTFGARGGGRGWALALDLALGTSAGPVALALPRAHALNLLGARPVADWSQPASALALGALAVLFAAAALARTKD